MNLDTASLDLTRANNLSHHRFDVGEIVDANPQQRFSVEGEDSTSTLKFVQGQIFLYRIAFSAADHFVGDTASTSSTIGDDVIACVEVRVILLAIFAGLITTVETLALGLLDEITEGEDEFRERHNREPQNCRSETACFDKPLEPASSRSGCFSA